MLAWTLRLSFRGIRAEELVLSLNLKTHCMLPFMSLGVSTLHYENNMWKLINSQTEAYQPQPTYISVSLVSAKEICVVLEHGDFRAVCNCSKICWKQWNLKMGMVVSSKIHASLFRFTDVTKHKVHFWSPLGYKIHDYRDFVGLVHHYISSASKTVLGFSEN